MALTLSAGLPFALVLILVVSIHNVAVQATKEHKVDMPFNRSVFAADFSFGAASSAYQYEGAYNESGKGPSIWDVFTHTRPEVILDRSNGDVAEDFYHRYKEDVDLLKGMGMDAFRFSISWPRILPKGTVSGGINEEGIKFYNNLIDYIISKGLKPFVTIFHWDLPQALEAKYLGFMSPQFVNDYRDYAELCFERFGDRVKHWITFNEPWVFCNFGYAAGTTAPGRCSPNVGNCTAGNSATEPYICGHHTLLAHGAAVQLYREKYQKIQKGKIGITLVTHWFTPYSNSKADEDATARALDFMLGWFLDPLTQGDYPFNMRAIVEDRLPSFTPKQTTMIKGSLDFLGVNYYTTQYVKSISLLTKQNAISSITDSCTFQTGVRNGVAIGPPAASPGFYTYPKGLEELMLYIKEQYNNPEMYITETGTSESGNTSIPLKKALMDSNRIYFYQGHAYYLHKAISKGANVKGLFAWSLLDNWEWMSGYTSRFGIIYIDRLHGLKRIPKASYYWFQKFLKV